MDKFNIERLDDLKESTLLKDKQAINFNVLALNNLFKNFSVEAEIVRVTLAPSTTSYSVDLAGGVKVNKVTTLKDNIALALNSDTVDIKPSNKGLLEIKVNNMEQGTASFKKALNQGSPDDNKPLEITLGLNSTGSYASLDLTKAPHILVSGATGSGKSVFLNSVINELIINHAESDKIDLILIDPKRVEFSQYKYVPMVNQVVTDLTLASEVIDDLVIEMNRRYALLEAYGVKNIKEFNALDNVNKINYKVLIVDELADLMLKYKKSVENNLVSLAQLARASGIHMILATQRPTTNIVTGNLKANIPTRISFSVASGTDSRVILDAKGAENLKGQGDMLVSDDKGIERLQGLYLTDKDIDTITDYFKIEKSSLGVNQELGAGQVDGAMVDYLKGKEYVTFEDIREDYKVGFNRTLVIVGELSNRGYVAKKLTSQGFKVLV